MMGLGFLQGQHQGAAPAGTQQASQANYAFVHPFTNKRGSSGALV
jgi:hypothetical protein